MIEHDPADPDEERGAAGRPLESVNPRPGRRPGRKPPGPATELAGDWIWHSNLRRFLELVSSYAGYSFDDSDWLAIEAGLQALGGENETFVYPIMGRPQLGVCLSTDPGSGDEITVKITGRPDRLLGARISGLIDAYQLPSGPLPG